MNANLLRRLNWLWKNRHTHEGDDTQDEITVIRETIERIIEGVNSPLTTKGDIWGFDVLDARIPVGTDGQILTADSTAALGVAWEIPTAGGGAPTIGVAASNATTYSTDKAELVCDGTNDEVQILAAIAECDPGGTVWLSEGTFNLGARILYPTITNNIKLMGMGAGVTTLFLANGVNNNVIEVPSGTHNSFQDFTINGNRLNQTAGTGDGIRVTDNWVWITNVEILNCSRDGYASSGTAHDHYVTNVYVENCASDGFDSGAGFTTFTHCTSNGNGSCGFKLETTETALIGCHTNGNTQQGIFLSGTQCFVVGCHVDSDGSYGILSGPGANQIIGNFVLLAGADGIRSQDSSFDVIVGNTVYQAQNHGIAIQSSNDCLVANNVVREAGRATTNTYDGISLPSFSDRNRVWGNYVVGAASAPKPRYGINVGASTCDDNIYVGNDVGVSTNYGTGKYNDSGTGTVNTWPGAATPQGDNF